MKVRFALEPGAIPGRRSTLMALKSEPSVIPGILMSDLSIVEHGTQKRSVIGCFDNFAFAQFPISLGRFWVTSWIANLVGTVSTVELTCRIQEMASAHVLFSSSTNITFPDGTALDPTNTLALNIPIDGLTFPRSGIYTIVLLLSGEEVGKRDIQVRQAPQPKKQ